MTFVFISFDFSFAFDFFKIHPLFVLFNISIIVFSFKSSIVN